MDPPITAPIGPIHPKNAQLGVFTNPLPSSHTCGCIGNVGISSELCSFFVNTHHFKYSSPKNNRYRARWHSTHIVNYCLQAIDGMHFNRLLVPLFIPTFERHDWVIKSPMYTKRLLDLSLTS